MTTACRWRVFAFEGLPIAKIYLSSSYSDLKDHREAVYHTLRKMRHDVIAMEDYVATDERPLDNRLADVSGSERL